MIRGYEIVLGIIMILALLFPLRPLFFRHFKTLIGAIVGGFAGRAGYAFISQFFSFESEIVKIITVILGAYLFAGATADFFNRVFPDKTG